MNDSLTDTTESGNRRSSAVGTEAATGAPASKSRLTPDERRMAVLPFRSTRRLALFPARSMEPFQGQVECTYRQ